MSRSRSRHAVDRAARREELLDAACAVIRRDGAASASMEAMAAEAGITKPILYRHFGDRAGLVVALGERFSNALMKELGASLAQADAQGDARKALEETIEAFIAFIEGDPEMYRFIAQRIPQEQPGATEILEDFIRQVSSQVAVVLGERMRAAGVDSGGAEPLAFGIVGLVHAAGDWWVERRTMPRSTLVDYLTRLLWGGFEGLGLGGAQR